LLLIIIIIIIIIINLLSTGLFCIVKMFMTKSRITMNVIDT